MAVLIGPLTETESRTNGKRIHVYFHVPVSVDRKTVQAEVHLYSTDGSIPEHVGKFYASFEGNIVIKGKSQDPLHYPVACPKCSAELAPKIGRVLLPELEKLGYPIAPGYEPGGWSLFHINAPTLGDIEFTGNNRWAGPELVIAEYKQALRCPFHGQVTRYDNEPID